MLKFHRPTLVTLTAPTCSGKNYLRDAIENTFDWTRIVSTTTRPQRSGEVEGQDYCFISVEQSMKLEDAGAFAELITFRNTRYGVTKREMDSKMDAILPPMVILEPQGLEMYKTMCADNGWDIFTIYISAPESVRIDRLNKRTINDLCAVTNKQRSSLVLNRFDNEVTQDIPKELEKLIAIHTDRLLSITNNERRWSNQSSWDAILPGDDVVKALDGLKMAVDWRNRKTQTPATYNH